MEMPERSTKRPVGWSKPYWARTGLYTAVIFVSALVSLIVVGFICGILLRAAIPAPPLVWRSIELVLDLCITLVITWYFGSQEGYANRRAYSKRTLGGGGLFLLMQLPVALVFRPAAGPMACTLAELIYFGNQSDYAASLEASPPLLVLACMVVVDLCVLIPAMIACERLGAKVYEKEKAELIEQARREAMEHAHDTEE